MHKASDGSFNTLLDRYLQFHIKAQIMRKPGEWMQPAADDRILEVLAERGNLQPSTISEIIRDNAPGLEYSDQHIGRRCRKLRDYGLLIKYGQGVYSITEEGKAYLAGDLDASTLDPDTD
jgi:hypothetical protein